jgi:hypothetical protein
VPDSVSIIGGAPDGEPQPMHYFDSRGVKRLFSTLASIVTVTAVLSLLLGRVSLL